MAESNHEFLPEAETEDPASGSSRCSFLYNCKTGAILGRTPASWAKICIFYVIYYTCLAGFFFGMLSVFLYGIVTEDEPHRTGLNSLLNMNPGLGFRPHINMEDTLIEFTAGQPESYVKYISSLQQLYDSYKDLFNKPDGVNVRSKCQPDDTADNEPEKVCKFDWDKIMPGCNPKNDFGFANGKPCVVLKLNKIFGWLPDPISSEVPHPLVQCRGEYPGDIENVGKLIYQPNITANLTKDGSQYNVEEYGYFNQAFYPYLKQIGYKAPLVGLVFENLKANTLAMVECRVFNMKNTVYDKVDRNGMVRFEIFMKS